MSSKHKGKQATGAVDDRTRAMGLLYLLQSAMNDWRANEGNLTVYSLDAAGEVLDRACILLMKG